MDDKLMYVPIGYKQTATNDHIKFCSKKGDAFIFFILLFMKKYTKGKCQKGKVIP